MIRLISVSAMLVSILTFSMSVYAQGHRPVGAGAGAGNRPSMSQHRDRPDTMRQQSEMRRQEAEARRLAAEANRQEADARQAEAEARRAAAEEHNRSEEARAEHPPNEHAADEAFRAELNADDNLALRDDRPTLGGENRREHGVDNRGEHGGSDLDDGDDD